MNEATGSTQPILVVDDFDDGRELLVEYLQFRGFPVVSAASGNEAVAMAARVRPSAVLMDLRMPDGDGWQATRSLRANPATAQSMIIAVTAHALAPEIESALNAGCDAVVSKPYDLAAFADALTAALRDGPEAFAVLGAPTRGRRTPRQ
jgi:CheY-like chemotaxis protein